MTDYNNFIHILQTDDYYTFNFATLTTLETALPGGIALKCKLITRVQILGSTSNAIPAGLAFSKRHASLTWGYSSLTISLMNMS
ncbi:MAG: hypothetical protein J6P53_07225 [Mailhella sp.]|nr:hypothetical protein [Mailhella sp.]